MKITFVNDFGQTYTIEIDPQMELENVMALLEAEVRQRSMLCESLSSGCTTRDAVRYPYIRANNLAGWT